MVHTPRVKYINPLTYFLYMVSLKQITQETITIASNIPTPLQMYTQYTAVISPTTPLILVDLVYYTTINNTATLYRAIGLINGSSLSTLPSNLPSGQYEVFDYVSVTRPVNFAPFQLSYWFVGCYCNPSYVSGCNGGQYIVAINPSNGDYVVISPSGQAPSVTLSILVDTQNLYFIILSGYPGNNSNEYVIFIPMSEISTFLNNSYPSNTKWAVLQLSGGVLWTFGVYGAESELIDGMLYLSGLTTSAVYIGAISESSILSSAVTGTPTTTSGFIPVTMNQVPNTTNTNAPANYGTPVVLKVIYYNISSNEYGLVIAYGTMSNNVNAIVYSVTTNSVVSQKTFGVWTTPPPSGDSSTITFVHGIVVNTDTSTQGVFGLIAYSPFNSSIETLSLNGVWGTVDSLGYVITLSVPIQNNSTLTVYQLLFDTTPAFQNVNITQSGSTVTATGTLVDLTTGNPISNATVYLVGVYSYDDNGIESYSVIASGTTNSNGQFSISGTTSSSFNYYGVVYVP